MSEAMEHVRSAPADVSELRAKLAAHHAEYPQRAAQADIALREVEDGLARLAALGHRYALYEVRMEDGEEFPKMLYMDTAQGLVTRIVENKVDMDKAMKEGWREHPTVSSPPERGKK